MGAAAELLTHFVGDRPYVCARGDARAEGGLMGRGRQNLEFFDFYLYWLERDFLLLAGQFVGGHSGNFFGGKRRRHLLDRALKLGSQCANFIAVYVYVLRRRGGLSIGVVGVSGDAEANHAFVRFLRMDVELRQAREAAEDNRQDSGGGGVKGSEMTDGALTKNSAHAVHYVVRC